MQKRKRCTQEVYRTETSTQAIQKPKKSTTEEKGTIPAALDQSSKV